MSATDHAATTESQSPGLSFAELTARVPLIHTSRSTTYRIHPRLAAFLDAQLQPDFVTLETGSGLSTLVILRKGVAKHIAIAPDGDEFQAIREFCADNSIATGGFQSVTMRSQDYLPRASLEPLNLVLVDGDHSFPVPFIDWYHTADALVVGGVMVIDDIQLITGRLLADFMDADPKWERILHEERRFAVFRKLSHPVHCGRWDEQPYVAASNPVEYVSVSRRVSIHPAVGALMTLYGYLHPRSRPLIGASAGLRGGQPGDSSHGLQRSCRNIQPSPSPCGNAGGPWQAGRTSKGRVGDRGGRQQLP